MDKKECINLISRFFMMESCVIKLKDPDFQLKSHIFYFNGMFQDIPELRIVRVCSRNRQDNIVFDIYYVSDAFEGLYHGYFRIKPESEAAKRLFMSISTVCTDIGEYFYYVYQNSNLLKIYLATGDLWNALDQSPDCDYRNEFEQIKRSSTLEIANVSPADLQQGLLNRNYLKKYISNFIKLNSKCSEQVKMFFIHILNKKYAKNICLVNHGFALGNYLNINPANIRFNSCEVPVYKLLEYFVEHNFILFIRMEFDFQVGVKQWQNY
ncbi:MAG: hypothetical protein N2645_02900 [Clostridia bacterium]|nr:hypothetical protein [Clostridia bacterium]